MAAVCADEDRAAAACVARTDGCRIVLADGRELIDGIASWWTACHGYNHPHIRSAVERQLAAMPHVMMGGLVHEQALTLARRLAALLPGDLDRVFFSESGSVAVEIALKMAIQFWINRGEPKQDDLDRVQGRLSRRHHRRDGGERSGLRHARRRSAGLLPAHLVVDLPTRRDQRVPRSSCMLQRHADEYCRHDRRAAGARRGRHALP